MDPMVIANYGENLPIWSSLNCLWISPAISGMNLKLSRLPKALIIVFRYALSSKKFSELSFS